MPGPDIAELVDGLQGQVDELLESNEEIRQVLRSTDALVASLLATAKGRVFLKREVVEESLKNSYPYDVVDVDGGVSVFLVPPSVN